MAKYYFTAIVEQASDGYGVSFPDLPGCVSAGDDFNSAIANAEAALALHLEGLAEDGEDLPSRSMPEDIERDPEVKEVARVMVGAEFKPAKIRFNVMMDKNLVAAIDAVSSNRSGFLSSAARSSLASDAWSTKSTGKLSPKAHTTSRDAKTGRRTAGYKTTGGKKRA